MKRAEAEQLFLKNMGLAHSMLHKYYPTFAQNEDMHQEALLGLWRACLTFDANKSQFSTYAGCCILNQIRYVLRGYAKQPDTVSLSTPIGVDETLTLEDVFEDPCPSTDEGSIALKIFLEGLAERDRQIINHKFEGLTQKQIAKKLDLSQVTISRTLKRLQQNYLKQEDQE